MKYALDEKTSLAALLLYGLQWWAVSLAPVIILGVVASRLHYADTAHQALYLQKMFGLIGVTTVAQVLWGHRLPLVVGPAAVLMVGLASSLAVGINAAYTAILIGGALLTLLAWIGLLARLRFFFTPRIIAVILMLIALTLVPTMLRLIFAGAEARMTAHLCFVALLVLSMVLCSRVLRGVWNSLTVVLGLVGGSLAYAGLLGMPEPATLGVGETVQAFFIRGLDFQPGTIFAFMLGFMALLINEVGSVESMGFMLRAEQMPQRLKRGTLVQGLANMAAGAMGVLGTVDYSLSTGVVAGTGCASRFPLVPAGLGLLACAFFPQVVLALSAIPSPVLGALMLYLMASQLASGLSVLVAEKGVADFGGGLTVGLPLLVGVVISFAPTGAFEGFPEVLRQIVGNGFVMGSVTVVVMEHILFRTRKV